MSQLVLIFEKTAILLA